MAEAVLRQATYADLEAVPARRVAEIIDCGLETRPRGRPPMHGAAVFSLEGFALKNGRWLLLDTIQRGETVALPPFDAAPFALNDLFPFDDPAAPALPET